MPSFSHELLVDLFRRAPPLARELLRRSAGVELPQGEDEAGSVDLSQVTSPSYSADVLILVRGERARALAAIVVEVQLNVDAHKRNSWPVYVASARREHDCPAFLLVVCPDEKVARWAGTTIELGHPGFRLEPLVVGPASVPRPSENEAADLPELAVLAALARPQEEEVARAAIAAVGTLAEEQARLYFDAIWAVLPEAVRAALEVWMQEHDYQSEFARRYLAEGMAKGMAEGKAEGKAEGEAAGRLNEARSALTRVLARRGFDVTPETQRKIDTEQNLARLERWHDVAVTAAALADVFSDA